MTANSLCSSVGPVGKWDKAPGAVNSDVEVAVVLDKKFLYGEL